MMNIQSNDWDEKYTEFCSRMTSQEQMDFALTLCGVMSAYLDTPTVDHCLELAETLIATDLVDRLATS